MILRLQAFIKGIQSLKKCLWYTKQFAILKRLGKFKFSHNRDLKLTKTALNQQIFLYSRNLMGKTSTIKLKK